MPRSDELEPGDKVVFRDDATTEGQPIGGFIREQTWTVVATDGERCELVAQRGETVLKLLTFNRKMRKLPA